MSDEPITTERTRSQLQINIYEILRSTELWREKRKKLNLESSSERN